MPSARAEFDPAYGRLVTAADGVARITCENPGPMTGPGTNTYLVGDERVCVVDPGPDDAEHREAIRRAVDGRAVEAVLITHRHRDHCGGAEALARVLEAPLLAVDATQLRRPLPDGLGVDRNVTADRHVGDGAAIDLGTVGATVIFTPGHGSDHICVAIEAPGGRSLLSGDHVMGWSTSVIAPPYGHMGDYLASLRRLLDQPEVLFLPGHGAPITAPHAHMRAVLNHRLVREDIILEQVRKDRSEVSDIADAAYPGLDPQMRPAAMLSTLAHVEHLEERGLVERSGESVRPR